MINILIPLAGPNHFFPKEDYPYPKPLVEINGKTMIEHVIGNFAGIEAAKQFIFVVNSEDCKKFHLDNVLNLLTGDACKIIKIDRETKGAACSTLMAVEHIDNDTPLLIANADQLLEESLQKILAHFEGYDGGVVTFESVHPRWSYARVDADNRIIETAEKRPISKHAIAGCYYFRHGSDFVGSAMNMIRKDANVNGLYFVAPTLNEMVLQNKKLTIYPVENSKYHTFYTPNKINEYIRALQC